MALPIYPSLAGLGWSVTKAPRFATRTQKAVSGRQLRVVDQFLPIWTFTLTYEILRDRWDLRGGGGAGFLGYGFDELRTLAGFFLQMQGSFGKFLFFDPTDSQIQGQYLTTGNGTFTSFQLQRTFGGFTEPIYQPDVVAQIYYNGVPQGAGNFALGADPNPGFLTDIRGNIPNPVVVTGDFSYYLPCHFVDDTTEFENFMMQLWAAKQVKFESVLL